MFLNSMCNNFTNKILGIYLTYSILTKKHPTLPDLVLFLLPLSRAKLIKVFVYTHFQLLSSLLLTWIYSH